MEEMIFENEMDMLQDWVSNIILERDGKGNIIERVILDDTEVE